MTYLLDVNVVMALAWPNQDHHRVARNWMEAWDGPFATCPITQLGFMRISSHPKLAPYSASPSAAVAWIQAITALPSHRFWADSLAPDQVLLFTEEWRHSSITDLYLLRLAKANGGRLLTFDRRAAQLEPEAVQMLL